MRLYFILNFDFVTACFELNCMSSGFYYLLKQVTVHT